MKRTRVLAVVLICSMLFGQTVIAEDTLEIQIPEVSIFGDTDSIIEPYIIDEASPEPEESDTLQYLQSETYANVPSQTAADGAFDYNISYSLDESLLNYTNVYTCTRQYVCEELNGVYFLQGAVLSFLDLSTGEYRVVYTFDHESDYVYFTDNILYWGSGKNTIIEYDLAAQTVKKTLTLDSIRTSTGIGVDALGRIYLGVTEAETNVRMLYLLSPEGTLLDSMEMDRTIYEFSGFGEDGSFYFVAYRNWVYWGYEHDMKALFTCSVNDNMLQEDKLACIENVCQLYFSEYQDCAALLGGHYLADYLGNVYDVTNIQDFSISTVLTIEHAVDEEVTASDSNVDLSTGLASIGVRMIYNPEKNSMIGYTSGKNLFEYDINSGELLGKYVTSHYVFNLLEYNQDAMIAIEREDGKFYIELIRKTDLKEVEPVILNLNESETYSSHTKEAVQQQWKSAQISSDIQVYKSTYSLSPYKEAVYTDEMKEALLGYSNYLRWLGGLTPVTSAPDETWSDAAKGAVVLTKTGELTHSPSQPEDMDDDFYEAAYRGCSESNLYGGGISEGKAASSMYFLKGWLDDTNNIGSYELGHRFTFLQRASYQIAYGSTDSYLAQTNVAYNNQENRTGTIIGVDNNDYCYPWPSAGYFPTDTISTKALWSINLNSDKIDLSNKAPKVEIKDLETGTVTDVSDSLGSSAYYGHSAYFSYFYGECFYFDPPQADSYYGKSYEVTISNLELTDGEPAEIVYTVNFFNAAEGDFTKGDINADKKIDLLDLVLCMNHVSKKSLLKENAFSAADIDESGTVDLLDLMRLLNYVSKKTSTL